MAAGSPEEIGCRPGRLERRPLYWRAAL